MHLEWLAFLLSCRSLRKNRGSKSEAPTFREKLTLFRRKMDGMLLLGRRIQRKVYEILIRSRVPFWNKMHKWLR
jgi:hypothetical protein